MIKGSVHSEAIELYYVLRAETPESVKQILMDRKEEMGIRRTIAGSSNVPFSTMGRSTRQSFQENLGFELHFAPNGLCRHG